MTLYLTKNLSPLLTDEMIATLRFRKIATVVEFLQENDEKLAEITGFQTTEIITIRQNLISNVATFPVNAYEAYREVHDFWDPLSTGIPCLDKLLDGGLSVEEMVEIYGLSGSGKTQLCLTLTAHFTWKLKKRVIYIDCKGDFSAVRLKNIMDSQGAEEEDAMAALSLLQIYRTLTVKEFLEAIPYVYQEKQQARDVETPMKLVIVDSLPALIYPFLGPDTSIQFFGLLNQVGMTLKQLAIELRVAVVYVSLARYWQADDTSSEPTASPTVSVSSQDLPNPSFGHLWRSVPHLRLLMSRSEVEDATFVRVMVVKSTRSPVRGVCWLVLDQRGLVEAPSTNIPPDI